MVCATVRSIIPSLKPYLSLVKMALCMCTVKNIRRIYGRMAGNRLPGHVPFFFFFFTETRKNYLAKSKIVLLTADSTHRYESMFVHVCFGVREWVALTLKAPNKNCSRRHFNF